MRISLSIVVLILFTSSVTMLAQNDKTAGEQRFSAAESILNQDLDAVLSLVHSGKYSQHTIDQLEIRVLHEDYLLVSSAALVAIDMEMQG